MGLINKMRKQNAVYWPPGVPDAYGRPAHPTLVPLVLTGGVNYRVRWEDSSEQVSSSSSLTLGGPPSSGDVAGTVNETDKALVYVGRLPDGSEVVTGGFLWLGDEADLVASNRVLDEGGEPVLDEDGQFLLIDGAAAVGPRANGAREVKRVEKLPNLKNTEYLRTCYL